MDARINPWHWQMIKILAKYSLQYNIGGKLIHQSMIEELRKHSQQIKEIIKRGEKAYANLEQARRRFNYVTEESQVDATIYEMHLWEKEIEVAMVLFQEEVEGILGSQTLTTPSIQS